MVEISSAENEFKSQDIAFSLYRLEKILRKILEYLEKHCEKEKDVKIPLQPIQEDYHIYGSLVYSVPGLQSKILSHSIRLQTVPR